MPNNYHYKIYKDIKEYFSNSYIAKTNINAKDLYNTIYPDGFLADINDVKDFLYTCNKEVVESELQDYTDTDALITKISFSFFKNCVSGCKNYEDLNNKIKDIYAVHEPSLEYPILEFIENSIKNKVYITIDFLEDLHQSKYSFLFKNTLLGERIDVYKIVYNYVFNLVGEVNNLDYFDVSKRKLSNYLVALQSTIPHHRFFNGRAEAKRIHHDIDIFIDKFSVAVLLAEIEAIDILQSLSSCCIKHYKEE